MRQLLTPFRSFRHNPIRLFLGVMGKLSINRLLIGTLLLVAACYNYSSKSFLASTKVAQNTNAKMHAENSIDTSSLPNTNWRNIEYISGEFTEQLSSFQDKIISEQCTERLAGFRSAYLDDTCAGPIDTNTTCCYCYFSRDGEPFGYMFNHKYWSCAVPRNNSLLDYNQTPVNIINGAKVVWVTGRFGHGNRFQNQVETYCQKVRDMNLFDNVNDTFCYWDSPDFVLQNKKFSKHLQYRNDSNDVSARGGGFWFHKSVLLRHHMDQYKDGDYLIWTDIDRLDFFQLGTFQAMMETMIRRRGDDDHDDLSMEVIVDTIEHMYTKEDMLVAFNATRFMRDSPQVMANLIVVRNSPTMKRLMDAWIDCMADWHMVSDEPSVLPNEENFFDHRHDQSVLSLLIKRFMTIQSVVGPPARPYQPRGEILTYKFQDNADPSCPFSSYNATMALEHVNGTI